jgi:phosphoglycolate phosphatase-like HAD superfamily hydrolase
MIDNYLLIWDIDYVMYTEKLPPDIVDRILNYPIEEIKEGEFERIKTSGLDDVLTEIGQKQAVASNGFADEQYKKLKGFGVLKFFNPDLIAVSNDMARKDMERANYNCDMDLMREIHAFRGEERPEHLRQTKEFEYMEKWAKPSDSMIFSLVYSYVAQREQPIEPANVWYVGDRVWDMAAIVKFGGRGLHVKSRGDQLLELAGHKNIIQIEYEDFPKIPEIIGNS